MFFRTTRWQRRGLCGAFALTIACAIAELAFAQKPSDDATLASVFKDWQSRQSILKSARYVLTGTTEFKGNKLPPGSPIRPCRYTLLLDFTRKRYRLELSEQEPFSMYADGKDEPIRRDYRTRISTSTYDGTALQKYNHRKANEIDDDRVADLSIGKGNLGPGACLGTVLWPIFFAHGIVPTVHVPLLVDKLPLTHDPDDFDIAGRQLLRGQNCLLVRTEPRPGMGTISDEFWIDPTQQSAIHRHIYFSGSVPWTSLDISWKNTAFGCWVDHWTETSYIGGRTDCIYRLRIASFETNPEVSDADFQLPAEPGMRVEVAEGPSLGKGLDPFKAAITTYRISPSGTWEEIAAKGFTTLEGKELPPENRSKWIIWTVGIGATIGVSLLYVLRWRRRRAVL